MLVAMIFSLTGKVLLYVISFMIAVSRDHSTGKNLP